MDAYRGLHKHPLRGLVLSLRVEAAVRSSMARHSLDTDLTAAAAIADVQAPELVRRKRSFVYRCRWPDEWPGLVVSGH